MSELINEKIMFTNSLRPTSIKLSDALKNELFNDLKTEVLPTTRVENWKYTRVAKLGKIDFKNEAKSISSINEFKIVESSNTLVFVNGNFDQKLSTIVESDKLSIKTLSNADQFKPNANSTIFEKSNIAFLNGGIEIKIAPKAVIVEPIQIIHILSGSENMSNFRIEVEAGDFSKASIIEGFFDDKSGEKNFCNTTSQFEIGANAFLQVDKIQNESTSSFHINKEIVNQSKDSTFTINTITLNGGLVRNDLNINVNGQNALSHLNGAYVTKDKQHVDNHTIVDHKVPNCESHELYKGVMDGKSTGVFNGKVFVRKDAQKINAFQSNGNVLLDNESTINSKPELEIYADDVKCSHGSTTGQLDDEATFYLRARGLSETSAKQLMISAFIGDVLEKIENENVLMYIHKILKERFGWEF